jgi:hypothetical protein
MWSPDPQREAVPIPGGGGGKRRYRMHDGAVRVVALVVYGRTVLWAAAAAPSVIGGPR